MKTYISGDITGIHIEDEKVKFETAENYLKGIGRLPINPLKINNYKLAIWPDRLVALSECDAIFMLSDWQLSIESRTEKYYCDMTGKEVLFQTLTEAETIRGKSERIIIDRVADAIQEVTGMTLSQYTEEDRENKGFFNRMIFAIQCQKACIKPEMTAKLLHRDYTTVLRYLKKYNDEYEYNPCFREIVEKVNQKLCPEKFKCDIIIDN